MILKWIARNMLSVHLKALETCESWEQARAGHQCDDERCQATCRRNDEVSARVRRIATERIMRMARYWGVPD